MNEQEREAERATEFFRNWTAPAPEAEPVAWVWNPASVAWERVRAYGHWAQGALYAFGPLLPDPLAEPALSNSCAALACALNAKVNQRP